MAHKILLNNQEFHFSKNNLPCLAHYQCQTGGSHFTVTMVANFFLQGEKILFFTAYPQAKDNFLEQTKGEEEKIFFVEKEKDLIKAQKYQAIILKSGDEKFFLQTLKTLKDLPERIVLIKNFEELSEQTINFVLKLNEIIISGDIDKSNAKKQISEKDYQTIIAFSQPKTSLPLKIPALEKYTGYLKTTDKEGFVNLQIKK